ncbi:MAG TPA: glycosyltransferase family 4 protein [Candidatus Limnocylindrales bacterium]|nr:glycosyltransferase family 4 protein [Candidatus Limnocylindrales bacterium]
MRIAQLAPTYERVPPAAYGGTELVVSLITEELVQRGHDVTLYASGDSETAAELRSVAPRAARYGDVVDGVRHAEYFQLLNAQACFADAAAGAFDIVHNHAGIEGLVLASASRTPVLTTNHNPFVAQTQPAWDAYPWAHNALSAASAATFPARGAVPPIHHGIDVRSFPFGDRPTDDLLFLGRFSPEKGAARAIEAAVRSGRRLTLAGKVDPADRAHFAAAIQPRLDGEQIRYVGEADGAMKRELLASARALLFPIEWDEPFGLVMIEAMSCGTPVLGFRRASVPEVVEDGLTGFVVDDIDRLVDAIPRADTIDRAACRRRAEERFGFARMVDDYERAYAEVVEGATSLAGRR